MDRSHENGVYTVTDSQIKISSKRLLNRYYKNYRHSKYTLSFNSNGELESIEADIKEKWPFPQSIWSDFDDIQCLPWSYYLVY